MDKGFKAELNYWDKELSLKGSYPDAILNRTVKGRKSFEFPIYIIRELDALCLKFKRKPRTLDLGSGAVSQLSWGQDTRIIKLICADPLAEEYKKLHEKYKIKINYDFVKCYGEELTKEFKENYFDFVWIHNSLDHSQNPNKVMDEVFKVLNPGGIIYLQGWENEGKHWNYSGLHQNDISEVDGTLYVNKDTKLFSKQVEEGLELVDKFFPTYGKRRWLKLIYKKSEK